MSDLTETLKVIRVAEWLTRCVLPEGRCVEVKLQPALPGSERPQVKVRLGSVRERELDVVTRSVKEPLLDLGCSVSISSTRVSD